MCDRNLYVCVCMCEKERVRLDVFWKTNTRGQLRDTSGAPTWSLDCVCGCVRARVRAHVPEYTHTTCCHQALGRGVRILVEYSPPVLAALAHTKLMDIVPLFTPGCSSTTDAVQRGLVAASGPERRFHSHEWEPVESSTALWANVSCLVVIVLVYPARTQKCWKPNDVAKCTS